MEGDVWVRVTREVVEELQERMSPPLRVMGIEARADGTLDLVFQTPEPTDEMVERALLAWRGEGEFGVDAMLVVRMRAALEAAFAAR